jgi:competence protein ComEC
MARYSKWRTIDAIRSIRALISDGLNNSYGHPHKETLKTLTDLGVEVLRTDELGTIVFSCDRMGTCEIHK